MHVDEALAAIDERNDDVNAVVTLDRQATGTGDGPLAGVPMTIKDAWATAGMRTTSGLREHVDRIPTEDAPAVKRLREAGAVILGKTNVPAEIGGQETANELFGRTSNPWNLERTAGGSSGGAAAALASGMCALELGSDSGGSIRQPAHCCGVFGHVATHGLVPVVGHLPPVVGNLLTDAGPMATHPALLAAALHVLADHDLRPAEPVQRVGVWCERTSAGVAAAIESIGGEPIPEAPFDLGWAELVAFHVWLADQGEADHEPVEAERRRLADGWIALLDRYDVVVCPVSPVVAVAHDPDPGAVQSIDHRLERTIDVDGVERPYLDQVTWNIVVGLAGLPATVAPVGFADGLPVGAQVVGRPGDDLTTIAVAGEIGRFVAPPG